MTDNLHHSVVIQHLGQLPEAIPIVAQWHQDEWYQISPDLTTNLRISLYKSYSCDNSIPFSLIATINNKPVGSASVVTSDMETHSHLSPWLASVFVHPEFRCNGIATQLIENCIARLKTHDFEMLYLFTPDQLSFYQKRGWQKMESMIYHNEPVDIMKYPL